MFVSQWQIRMPQDTDFTLFTDFYINSNPSSICWKPENYREIEQTLQVYLQTLYFHPFKWISLYMYFVQYMWYILQRVLSFFMFSSIHGNDSRKLMGRDRKLFWCAALCRIVWAISKRPIPWTAGRHTTLFSFEKWRDIAYILYIPGLNFEYRIVYIAQCRLNDCFG